MTRNDMVAQWQRLTAPHENVTDSRQRRQSELLASLMLATMIVSLLSSPLVTILNPGARWAQVQLVFGLIDALLAYVAYRMARLGDYHFASILISVFGSMMIALSAFISGGDAGLHLLYYLVIVILFTSMFLPVKIVIGIALFQHLVMLGYGLIIETTSIQRVVNGPLLFNILFATATMLIVRHRNRLDHEQQALLAESEMRYRTVADLAVDYAYSFRVEPDGSFTPEWLTDSYFELTGYSPQDLNPQDNLKHYHPDDHAAIKAHQRAVAGGESRCDEYRLIAKNGTEYWVQIACRPVWDKSGHRVERIFGVAQDITERKLAEEERLEMALAQVRSDLMYGFFRQVAHDFRTSLTVIETSRYMVQQYLQRGVTTQVAENLEIIAYQVNRLNQQIENLRVLTRLNSPTTEPCDLNQNAREEMEKHKAAISKKNLDCAFEPDPTAPCIHAHPQELQRAIGLLLQNAIGYNAVGGAVTLRVTQDHDLVVLEVSDSGIGVDPDDKVRIFEFFYRAENATAHAPDGYGLGLSVAQMITEAYGGQITVESKLGEGSTFKMMFPQLNQP